MAVVETVEDLFRGTGLVLTGTLGLIAVVSAALFLVLGVYGALKTGMWGLALSGLALAVVCIGVPAALAFIGRKAKVRRGQ